jgi:hypothetical protein
MKEEKMDLFENKYTDMGSHDSNDKFEDIVTPEIEAAIKELYNNNPQLKNEKQWTSSDKNKENCFTTGSYDYNPEDAWIQTHSGRRFNPTNPIVEAIVIEDIAHALSNICRFTGHCSSFYSVAQHCVLVSYICNQEHAIYGLLHDGSEAYCQDIASPIKKTSEFSGYREVESRLQKAVYKRFGLLSEEPNDVKKADLLLLSTEVRDLMSPVRLDWNLNIKPLPFKIIPLQPIEAEKLFLERFKDLYCQK